MEISYSKALRAMEIFLEVYYLRDKSDDIGLLLSDINLDTFVGGKTADPAAWEDWLDAIALVKPENENAFLTETESFETMITFVRAFGLEISSKEIESLLKEILVNDKGYEPKQDVWQFWLKCIPTGHK